MPGPETLTLFLAASFAIAIAPGPSNLYVLARTLAHGRAAGFLSAGGLALGGLVHAVAAALGLSALFAVSPLAFALLKYAGATYLIGLGLRMLLARPPAGEGALQRAQSVSPGKPRIVAQAALTEILNPKVAVFFIAFLPQFIEPGAGSAAAQLLLFGILDTLVGLPCDAAVAAGGHSLARVLVRSAPVQRLLAWLGGTVLVALGAHLALSARQ